MAVFPTTAKRWASLEDQFFLSGMILVTLLAVHDKFDHFRCFRRSVVVKAF